MFWRHNFTLRGKNAFKHMEVIGKIGKGKSAFLRNLFLEHMKAGIGVAVIDPHGDLAVDCLWSLLDSGYFQRDDATDRLLYVDFSNPEYFLPWNILKEPYPPKTISEHITECCRRVWPYLSQAAPQFENIMKTAVTTLVENDQPITEMNTLLLNHAVRRQLLHDITDRSILELFARYDSWGTAAAALMRESTLNKAFLLTFNDTLRYTFGQRKNSLNFRHLIDEGISVIFNLSGLDDETQSLLGSLLALGFENAAFSRADMLPEERRFYRPILDEFQNYTSKNTKGFNKSLFGGRKYHVNWTFSHQSMAQLSEELQEGLENTMWVCFALGHKDAEYFAPILGNFDPFAVKEEIPDEQARPRMHKERFRLQETQDQWIQELKTLPVRVAYTRVENRTQKIKTIRHQPYTTSYQEVQKLIREYTESLMTPLYKVKRDVDGLVEPITPEQKLLPAPRFLLAGNVERHRTLEDF